MKNATMAMGSDRRGMCRAVAISEEEEKSSMAAAVSKAPITRNGLRRPKRERELSDKRPTIGCTIRPESGPATQARDTRRWGRPRRRR